MKKYLITFFFLTFLVGCQSIQYAYYDAYTVNSPVENKSQVVIKLDEDKFEKSSWLSTGYYFSEYDTTNISESQGMIYKYRSLYKNDLHFTQIYFVFKNPDWYFFDNAFGEDGRNFEFHNVDRETWSGGNIYETFAITLKNEDINILKSGDYKIKLVGKRGDKIIKIDSKVTNAFFDRQEQVNATF